MGKDQTTDFWIDQGWTLADVIAARPGSSLRAKMKNGSLIVRMLACNFCDLIRTLLHPWRHVTGNHKFRHIVLRLRLVRDVERLTQRILRMQNFRILG